ncbi:MAG: MarR family winged helix-turn-helix transcriptional regulator [Bacteroidia bacterium]
MRLEDEIKQKSPFKTAKERAIVNLLFTNNWMVAQQKQTFKPYGITLQQFNVLRILRGQHPEPISTSEIRDRMLDRMSDVSRIVDRLVKKKLVARKTCKSDKRLVDVIISQDGLDLLLIIDKQINLQHFAQGISEEQAQQLNELLDKLRSTTEEITE